MKIKEQVRKISSTFRLSVEAWRCIKLVASSKGLTATAVIEVAVRELAKSYGLT